MPPVTSYAPSKKFFWVAAKLNPSIWNRRTKHTVQVSFMQAFAMASDGEVEGGMLGNRGSDGKKMVEQGGQFMQQRLVALKTG